LYIAGSSVSIPLLRGIFVSGLNVSGKISSQELATDGLNRCYNAFRLPGCVDMMINFNKTEHIAEVLHEVA